MRAGELDRRVELQRRSLIRDDQGQQVDQYSTYATVWAKKKDLQGREAVMAEQTNAEVTSTFTIRYRADMLTTDRILYKGVSYNIRPPIAEIGRREGLEMRTTALVP